MPLLVRCFNEGYMLGHHRTVEGGFAPIYSEDKWDYFEEDVMDFVGDLLA